MIRISWLDGCVWQRESKNNKKVSCLHDFVNDDTTKNRLIIPGEDYF